MRRGREVWRRRRVRMGLGVRRPSLTQTRALWVPSHLCKCTREYKVRQHHQVGLLKALRIELWIIIVIIFVLKLLVPQAIPPSFPFKDVELPNQNIQTVSPIMQRGRER